MPDLPQRLIDSGRWNKVPLIIGNNHDEGNFFILNVPTYRSTPSAPARLADAIPVENAPAEIDCKSPNHLCDGPPYGTCLCSCACSQNDITE